MKIEEILLLERKYDEEASKEKFLMRFSVDHPLPEPMKKLQTEGNYVDIWVFHAGRSEGLRQYRVAEPRELRGIRFAWSPGYGVGARILLPGSDAQTISWSEF